MDQFYLFAMLAGVRVAVNADEVEAVVKLAEISPVPGMGAHVAGLSALRSRVLTIIDAAVLIPGGATPGPCRDLAIIANIGGHSYGLMVDAVSDICHVAQGESPLHGQLDPVWSAYARAIVDYEGIPHLLISLASFIDAGAVAQAA